MHREYKRIVGGSDRAVLFIHGIVGTPNHFKNFLPLIPENFSVHNILLDGHGKGVKDFSKTSMKKWEAQIHTAVNALAEKHNEVFIVGHSLGSLLALEQAIKNPKVSKLFLLAVPLRLFIKPRMLINTLRIYFNKTEPEDAVLTAARNCYGIANDRNPFHYLGWIPRYLELFSKIRRTRKEIELIKIPCEAYQSARDEMVSKKAKDILLRNPNISVMELENAGHYYYPENEFALIKDGFIEFLGLER